MRQNVWCCPSNETTCMCWRTMSWYVTCLLLFIDNYEPGLEEEYQVCDFRAPCPIGNWLNWTPFTPCSPPCGLGKQFRTRVCVAGECPGLAKEDLVCNNPFC